MKGKWIEELHRKTGKHHYWSCLIHGPVPTFIQETCLIQMGARWCLCTGPDSKRISHCPRCRREHAVRKRLIRRKYKHTFDTFWFRYYDWKASREKATRLGRGIAVEAEEERAPDSAGIHSGTATAK